MNSSTQSFTNQYLTQEISPAAHLTLTKIIYKAQRGGRANYNWLGSQIEKHNERYGTCFGTSRWSIARSIKELKDKLGLETWQDKSGGLWHVNEYTISPECLLTIQHGKKNFFRKQRRTRRYSQVKLSDATQVHATRHHATQSIKDSTKKVSSSTKIATDRADGPSREEDFSKSLFNQELEVRLKLKDKPPSLQGAVKNLLSKGENVELIGRTLDKTIQRMNDQAKEPLDSPAAYFYCVFNDRKADWEYELAQREQEMRRMEREEKAIRLAKERDEAKFQEENAERNRAIDELTKQCQAILAQATMSPASEGWKVTQGLKVNCLRLGHAVALAYDKNKNVSAEDIYSKLIRRGTTTSPAA